MKYINLTIFLTLIVFVTGCQKKEQSLPNSTEKQKKVRTARRGPTKMQTKKQIEV